MALSLPFSGVLSMGRVWLLAATVTLAALAGSARAQAPAATAEAHCLMLPLAPEQRVQLSALIVEAQVRDAQSFWDAGHHRLFTRHRLQVFSVLKGQPTDTAGLVLLTEGGRLGLDQQTLTNTLQLAPGQRGVFFLAPAAWPGLPGTGHLLTPVGSQQGFIEVNPADGTAAEPFRTYPALDAAFYQHLARLTGQARQVLQPLPALPKPVAARPAGTLAPVVTGLSPLSLPAGVGAVLTITGSGFGSSRGTGFVEFRNADDGGNTRVKARETDYLTWTDTRIQVRVPSAGSGGRPAGSGLVRVTTDGQLQAESLATLTVIYALTNVESTDGTILQRPNHVAQNASGGISFQLGPNFVAGPTAAWQRALAVWRCNTGMNWDGAAGPSNAIADDGMNVVAFDQGTQLPTLVLGRTTSYYRGCYAPDGSVVFWVKEIDMQFDDATNFQFGPATAVSPQIDFETVAVHELGHAQQLGHLILPGAVMHYAVARGQNARTLSAASDIAGGRQVLRVRSFRNLGCGGPALLPAPLTALSATYTGGPGLSWTTRDECFLSSFVVERSADRDTTGWQRVGTVAARPPAAQYSFTDAQAPAGLHYYRLRLVRPDGSLDNAAPVLLSSEGATAGIFPNPVTGTTLQFQYPSTAAGVVTFRVYDEQGRLVRAVALNASAGLSLLSLEVAGVRPGFYLLHWQDAQGSTGSLKFVRQ
ncbi:T9SS type A sorting domain-containing protein [Hymenobacter sp. DH14]|uniref:T9SS type A sorting domain-containing protein n=1 Tax=Hymenobacter cyanobacteriorum TaxID=2926463 RepID=A0A9X1VHL6_9BACT|nr:T9SS type A sorting domain-containing protein [Hymenobacter cyanobacteriorum]MCI1188775.1 T9SS type A sorting domain-containing protein [Hymenobacter cyanobacteriorum]